MADEVYDIYHGGNGLIEATDGGNWYDTYISYAVKNGIITKDEFHDYTVNATKAAMALIFAASLPESELVAINTISGVPDVSENDVDGTDIYRLY